MLVSTIIVNFIMYAWLNFQISLILFHPFQLSQMMIVVVCEVNEHLKTSEVALCPSVHFILRLNSNLFLLILDVFLHYVKSDCLWLTANFDYFCFLLVCQWNLASLCHPFYYYIYIKNIYLLQSRNIKATNALILIYLNKKQ